MLSFQEYARHPQLAALADRLANTSAIDGHDRLRLIEAAADCAGISRLDVEMIQPGAATRVPFAPNTAAPADEYQEAITRHVHTLIVHQGGRK